jgi:hypothetical protein
LAGLGSVRAICVPERAAIEGHSRSLTGSVVPA